MTMKALRKPYDGELWRSNKAGGIRSLCERRYWTRLWVVQELQLANDITILCGTETLPWTTFVSYIGIAVTNAPRWKVGRDPTSDYQALVNSPAAVMMRNVLEAQKSARLLDLVLAFKGLNCADPRDRVYALLGITDSTDKFVADYSLPIAAILHSVLRDHHKMVEPQSLEEVRQQCFSLCDAAGLTPNHIFGIPGLKLDLDDDAVLTDLERKFSMLAWGKAHSHERVVDLCHQEIMAKYDISQLFFMFIQQGKEALVRVSVEHGLIRPNSHHLTNAIHHERYGIAMILSQCESIDINEPDESGHTPLMRAVEESEEYTRLLLKDSRVNVNKRDPRTSDSRAEKYAGSQSPLHLAIWSRKTETAKQGIANLLLDHPDIDVNCKDDRGCTPLQAAISRSFFPVVERLIQDDRLALNGRSFFGCDGNSNWIHRCPATPWGVIDYKPGCSSCKYLPSVLCVAVKCGSWYDSDSRRIIKALLARMDLDVNEGRPLHIAITRGGLDVVEMILRRKDLSLVETKFSADGAVDEPGTMVSALQGRRPHLDILRVLLDSGQPIDLAGELEGCRKLGLNTGDDERTAGCRLLEEYEKRRRPFSPENKALKETTSSVTHEADFQH